MAQYGQVRRCCTWRHGFHVGLRPGSEQYIRRIKTGACILQGLGRTDWTGNGICRERELGPMSTLAMIGSVPTRVAARCRAWPISLQTISLSTVVQAFARLLRSYPPPPKAIIRPFEHCKAMCLRLLAACACVSGEYFRCASGSLRNPSAPHWKRRAGSDLGEQNFRFRLLYAFDPSVRP